MIVKKLYALNVRLKRLKDFIKVSFMVKMEATAQVTAQLVEAATKTIIIGYRIKYI